jgi:hypothetical protein
MYTAGAGDSVGVTVSPSGRGAASFDVMDRASDRAVARSSAGQPAAFSARAGETFIVVIR